jgi:hypothetical protein
MFALSRLKEAGLRHSERRFEVGEVSYTRKKTRSAVRVRSSALYFVLICRRNRGTGEGCYSSY